VSIAITPVETRKKRFCLTSQKALPLLSRKMKLPTVPLWRDGVSWAELRRSLSRLRSHELQRGRLTILSGRSPWWRPILAAVPP